MIINGFAVTSNQWDDVLNYVDENSCHLELDGCIRLVHLQDTEFNTVKELKKSRRGINILNNEQLFRNHQSLGRPEQLRTTTMCISVPRYANRN